MTKNYFSLQKLCWPKTNSHHGPVQRQFARPHNLCSYYDIIVHWWEMVCGENWFFANRNHTRIWRQIKCTYILIRNTFILYCLMINMKENMSVLLLISKGSVLLLLPFTLFRFSSYCMPLIFIGCFQQSNCNAI